jgi:hypothetical protein
MAEGAAPRAPAADARAANVALIAEQMAEHIGALAYVWGYPMVDMRTQMHNETHRVREGQEVLAPLGQFHRREHLVTPATGGELRAPNNDTLYLSGWFDLAKEPAVIHVPDTANRYYTLAVTDFFNEVTHLGRRTTGTAEADFALIGPDWQGALPAGLKPVRVATPQVWILGRVLVDGETDFPAALAVLRGFWSAPLSAWQRGKRPPETREVPAAEARDPRGSLDYFTVLNDWLRAHAAHLPADEGALMALFDRVGFGPRSRFDPEALDAATRAGLKRALTKGRAIVTASANMPQRDVRNGWVLPLGLADYGHDYLARASVVFGGYANRPEESTYAALVVDAEGRLLSGEHRYRLRFTPATVPPAGAFWSLAAYDLQTRNLIENPIRRYSLGDRTPGLKKAPDGSFVVELSHEPPADEAVNWLPVGQGNYLLIARIYEPGPAVFDGSYAPPALELVD